MALSETRATALTMAASVAVLFVATQVAVWWIMPEPRPMERDESIAKHRAHDIVAPGQSTIQQSPRGGQGRAQHAVLHPQQPSQMQLHDEDHPATAPKYPVDMDMGNPGDEAARLHLQSFDPTDSSHNDALLAIDRLRTETWMLDAYGRELADKITGLAELGAMAERARTIADISEVISEFQAAAAVFDDAVIVIPDPAILALREDLGLRLTALQSRYMPQLRQRFTAAIVERYDGQISASLEGIDQDHLKLTVENWLIMSEIASMLSYLDPAAQSLRFSSISFFAAGLDEPIQSSTPATFDDTRLVLHGADDERQSIILK